MTDKVTPTIRANDSRFGIVARFPPLIRVGAGCVFNVVTSVGTLFLSAPRIYATLLEVYGEFAAIASARAMAVKLSGTYRAPRQTETDVMAPRS